MTLPEEIKIGDLYYRIHIVPAEDLVDADADCHIHAQNIRVRDDATQGAAEKILGHEVAHVWLAWSGLSSIIQHLDSATFEKFGFSLEEALCDVIGDNLIQFMRDNAESL